MSEGLMSGSSNKSRLVNIYNQIYGGGNNPHSFTEYATLTDYIGKTIKGIVIGYVGSYSDSSHSMTAFVDGKTIGTALVVTGNIVNKYEIISDLNIKITSSTKIGFYWTDDNGMHGGWYMHAMIE